MREGVPSLLSPTATLAALPPRLRSKLRQSKKLDPLVLAIQSTPSSPTVTTVFMSTPGFGLEFVEQRRDIF